MRGLCTAKVMMLSRKQWKAKQVFFVDTLPLLFVQNTKKFSTIIGGQENNPVHLVEETGTVIPHCKSCFALNNVFKKAFSPPSPNTSSYPIKVVNFPPMERVAIDMGGIILLIGNLKVSSSSGGDGRIAVSRLPTDGILSTSLNWRLRAFCNTVAASGTTSL